MKIDWFRGALEPPPEPGSDEELLSAPRSRPAAPWLLFVGENETALDQAARRYLARDAPGLPAIRPPSAPPLPIAVHVLPPPGLRGPRALYAPRLERGFFDALSFSAASPLYLLPKLSHLASEGEPLTFVATALESRARDLVAGRGLASRFEIRRLPGAPAEIPAEPDPSEGLSPAFDGLARGLREREPALRARAYESAVASEPGSPLGHLFLASSLLERKKRNEAVAALARAIELDPAIPAAHYELGKALILTDDMEGALAAFRRTTELLPDYPSAWGNLGAALGEVQDLEAATAALERAVALDPLSHALRSNLGVTLRDRGLLRDAEAELRRALELDPGFVFGHYNLAHLLYLAERYGEAIAAFERARSLDRSASPRQALLLAVTRLAAGDPEGAHRDYRAVFDHVSGAMKSDMRTVAEWDLKQLAQRRGVTKELKEAAGLLRTLA